MNTRMNRAAAAVGGLAIAAACAVGCAQTQEAAKDVASSAASVGSSAASVAGSAASSAGSAASSVASSGASVAGSAASSGASVASSAVSSVLNRAPDAVKEGTGKAAEKTGWNWWWIPLGIALAALLAGLLRMLTRRKHVEVAAQRAPDVTTTRVVTDPKRKDVVTDPKHKDDRRNH